MRITEREKVLCEYNKDIIATIRITFVDQILRQLLHRYVMLRCLLLEKATPNNANVV